MIPSKFITELNLQGNRESSNFGKASLDNSNFAYTKNNYNFAGYEKSKVSFSMYLANNIL